MGRTLIVLLALGAASCHHGPVKVSVHDRTYYGLSPEAQDGDALCVASEQAGDPMVCLAIGQIKAYIRQTRYAP